jgi:hypothetical protein
MYRNIGWAWPLVFALVGPALAADAKDKDKDAKDSKFVPIGQLVGRVAAVQGSQKTFTLKVSTSILEPYRAGYRIGLRVRQISHDVEVKAADDITVRVANPPLDYDDKGKPKKYTAKELKDLKGPGNQWGFPSDFESLKGDQIVKVFLGRKKDAPKAPPKGKDKEKAMEFLEESKPVVTQVWILAELKK